MKHTGRRLRRTRAPFTAGGSKNPWPCHSVTSFDDFQQWVPGEITIVMRGAAFRCSLYLRINGWSLMLPLNVFFLQLQFHVLCVCGVETSSRGGGFRGLPQQTAAVQPGRSSQQGRPQRVSRVPAFSSPSLKWPGRNVQLPVKSQLRSHKSPIKPFLSLVNTSGIVLAGKHKAGGYR